MVKMMIFYYFNTDYSVLDFIYRQFLISFNIIMSATDKFDSRLNLVTLSATGPKMFIEKDFRYILNPVIKGYFWRGFVLDGHPFGVGFYRIRVPVQHKSISIDPHYDDFQRATYAKIFNEPVVNRGDHDDYNYRLGYWDSSTRKIMPLELEPQEITLDGYVYKIKVYGEGERPGKIEDDEYLFTSRSGTSTSDTISDTKRVLVKMTKIVEGESPLNKFYEPPSGGKRRTRRTHKSNKTKKTKKSKKSKKSKKTKTRKN
jgi:hypothetical protein